ncbi:MAG TPA: glycosyltransferase [Chloroflexota bacterium]|nr:glycosyltransferase [Chloroflexota bacterium]
MTPALECRKVPEMVIGRDRLKVVHVYKDVYPVVGGIENFMRALCRELARQPDLDIRMLVTSPDTTSTVARLDGVQVIRAARLATVASTPISPRLALELRRLHPDIVHLHSPYPVGETAALLATPATPTVITFHSDVVRQKTLLKVYGPVLRRVLRHADRILPTSPSYARSSPWLQAVRDRCTIVPLGIDLAPFRTIANRGDGRTILFVGRFRYYKGLRYLLDALPLISDARLVLVGGGPAEADLRAQAAALGLAHRVTFATGVSDRELPRFYAEADIFVLPACERSEAFGLVLVEALASGLPCVSTELQTGTSYVNKNGETGLVVPPADPGALAAACRALLADPALRARMGAAGRRRATRLFDITRVAAEVAAVYREVRHARR